MRSFAVLALLHALPSLLSAQDPAPRPQDDVVIEGRPETSKTAPSLQEARRRIEFSPGGVDVIDGEEYRTGRVFLPEDVFRFSPGVYVQTRFGAEESRMSIRGSGLQRTFHGRGMVVMQDGVPINLSDGSFDMQAIEPLAAKYVEVWRGANALRYGSATLGGAVNFVSPTGHDQGPLLARFEGGSFGYLRGQAGTGAAADAFDFFGTFTDFDTDGFRVHARQSNQRIFTNFGYRFAPDLESRLYVTWTKTDSELPGSLTRDQMLADPEQANPGNVTNDWKRDFWLFRVADRTTWTFGPEARLDFTLAYSHKHLDHPIFQVIDQESDDLVFSAAFVSEAKWFGNSNRFSVGILPGYGRIDDERYANVGGTRGAQLAHNDLAAASVSFFLEEQHYVLQRLAVVAGLQVHWVELDQDDVFPTGADNSGRRAYTGINPKIGLRFDLADASQVFFNASRSFEPPSWGETLSPGTGGIVFPEAQDAWTFEIGTRGKSGPFAWDLAVYAALIDGELLALTDGAGNPLGTVNADRTLHAGVELGLDVVVWEAPKDAPSDLLQPSRVLIRQSYLWNYFRFDGDAVFGDNELAGIPEHLFRMEVRLEHPSGLYLAPSVEWAPEGWFVDHANTFRADGYATFGLQLGFRAEGLTIFFEARNLGNRIYAPTTGVVNNAQIAPSNGNPVVFNPADERSFYGGVEYRY
jgi:iron complex outermembrane receptor protein